MGFPWASLAGQAIDVDERPQKAETRSINAGLYYPFLYLHLKSSSVEGAFRRSIFFASISLV